RSKGAQRRYPTSSHRASGIGLRGHLHDGESISDDAAIVRLAPKAVREIGRRRCVDSGLEQALYDEGGQVRLWFANNRSANNLLCSNTFITVVESAELRDGND